MIPLAENVISSRPGDTLSFTKRCNSTVLVGVNEIAGIFELSARRVQQIVPFGSVRPAHGKYDLGLCMVWFIRHQSARLEDQINGHSGIMRSLRLRVLRANNEIKEFSLQRRKSRLIPVAVVEEAFAELASMTRAVMKLAAERIAAEITGTEDYGTVEATIRKHVYQALFTLSKGPPSNQDPVSHPVRRKMRARLSSQIR